MQRLRAISLARCGGKFRPDVSRRQGRVRRRDRTLPPRGHSKCPRYNDNAQATIFMRKSLNPAWPLYPATQAMSQEKLTPGRLEAFSDGVIAVIITIMVLELKVPSLAEHANNLEALRADLPLLLVYLLSFVQTGIYWVNHHYLIDDLDQVTHGILWTNLLLLFSLSLIPLGTEWLAIRGISSFSVALYAVICAMPGVSWIPLSTLICRRADRPLASGLGQQLFSFALYVGAVPMAYVSPYISLAMLALVAILWLLPPRKIVQLTRSPKEAARHQLGPVEDPPPTHSDSR